MTALDRYVRLESGGLWRAGPDAQRREVTVSFGDATLVMSDTAGRPLAHWSLPAISRQNPDDSPAIYAPDDEGSETLEVSDPLMTEAIEQVRGALDRARPRPGKLRHLTTISICLAIAALAIFWLPGALTRQTLSVVPAPQRTEIGAIILGHIQRDIGPACREPSGSAAAQQLLLRLFGSQTPAQLVVLPALQQGAIALPGGIILLDRALLEQTDDPAVAAGYTLAAHTAARETDPLEDVLTRAGLGVTFRLLTTGDIPPEVLQNHAAAIAQGTGPSVPRRTLRAAFETAQIPSTPYVLMSQARNDDATVPATDPMEGQPVPLILGDDEWVSLQNICNV